MSRPIFRRLLPPRPADQFDEEIAAHVALRLDEYRQRGMSEEAAQRAVQDRMGDLGRARSECITVGRRTERRMLRATFVEHVMQDIRIGWRGLLRNKGWTAVALITLGLGIGACTAVYSVVNSLLLHPVPYPRGDDVVLMYGTPGNSGAMQVFVGPSPDALLAARGNTRTITDIEPWMANDMMLLQGGAPEVTHTARITPTFIRFAGQHVVEGRGFTAEDARPGAPRVALLSQGFWRRRFGGDPAMIGKTIVLNGDPITVIGVVPSGLVLLGHTSAQPDVWLPLDLRPDSYGILAAARLAPGTTIAAAQRELETIATAAKVPSAASFKPLLQRPASMVNFRTSLPLLGAAVVLVLLIACVNVAHLLLARGATRERELALRAALGAGRGRIFRQLVTESMMLAGLGWLAGTAVGWAGMRLLLVSRPDALSELDAIHLDSRVLGAAFVLALATGLIFGVVVALQLAVRAPYATLRAGAPSSGSTPGHRRFRGMLVITEIAVSAALVVGAALLVRGMIRLQQTSPGFDTANVYSFRQFGEFGAKPAPGSVERTTARLRALPGVVDVTISGSAPPMAGGMFGALEAEGSPIRTPTSFIQYNAVSRGYFSFLRIPIVAGNIFSDTTATSTQLLVNRGFAEHFWPGQNPVGRRLRLDKDTPWLTVVGIVADVAVGGPTSNRSEPILYTPGPDPDRVPVYLVRMRPNFNPMAAMRRMAVELEPHAPPPAITRISDALDETIARPRFTMMLLMVFAAIAALLAAVGLYGLLAYSVTERSREIGVRVALGATRTNVLAAVLRSGLGLAAAGTALGLIGAYFTSHLLGKLLYQLPPTDTVSFVTGAVVTLAVASLASVLPARRALRIDPMAAIRSD